MATGTVKWFNAT
jgi:CspA family cold shock protein